MARRVNVVLLCDVHEGEVEATETVSFAYQGTSYEIVVCAEHAEEMRSGMALFIKHAREADGGRQRRRSTRDALQ